MDTLRSALRKIAIETSGIEEGIEKPYIYKSWFVKRVKGFTTISVEGYENITQTEIDWSLFYDGSEYRFVQAGRLVEKKDEERIDLVASDFTSLKEKIVALGDKFITVNGDSTTDIFIDDSCPKDVINDDIFKHSGVDVYVVSYFPGIHDCFIDKKSTDFYIDGYYKFHYINDDGDQEEARQQKKGYTILYDKKYKSYVCQKMNRAIVITKSSTLDKLLTSDTYRRVDDTSSQIYVDSEMYEMIIQNKKYAWWFRIHTLFKCEDFTKTNIHCVVSKAPKLGEGKRGLGYPMIVREYLDKMDTDMEIEEESDEIDDNYVVYTESAATWRLYHKDKKWWLRRSESNEKIGLDEERLLHQTGDIYISEGDYSKFLSVVMSDNIPSTEKKHTYNAHHTHSLQGRRFIVYVTPSGTRKGDGSYKESDITEARLTLEENNNDDYEEDDYEYNELELKTLYIKKGILANMLNKVIPTCNLHYGIKIVNKKNVSILIKNDKGEYIIIQQTKDDYQLRLAGKEYQWGLIDNEKSKWKYFNIPDLIATEPPNQTPVWMDGRIWIIACGQSEELPFNYKPKTGKKRKHETTYNAEQYTNVYVFYNINPISINKLLDEATDFDKLFEDEQKAFVDRFYSQYKDLSKHDLEIKYDQINEEIGVLLDARAEFLKTKNSDNKKSGFHIKMLTKEEKIQIEKINAKIIELEQTGGSKEEIDTLRAKKDSIEKTDVEIATKEITDAMYEKNKLIIDQAVNTYKQEINGLQMFSSCDIFMVVSKFIEAVFGKGLSPVVFEETLMLAYTKSKTTREATSHSFLKLYPIMCDINGGEYATAKKMFVPLFEKEMDKERAKISLELDKLIKGKMIHDHRVNFMITLMPTVCAFLYQWSQWDLSKVTGDHTEVIDDMIESSVMIELKTRKEKKEKDMDVKNADRSKESLENLKNYLTKKNVVNYRDDDKLLHTYANIYNMLTGITPNVKTMLECIEKVYFNLEPNEVNDMYTLIIFISCLFEITKSVSSLWFFDFKDSVTNYDYGLWKKYFDSVVGIKIIYIQRLDTMRKEFNALNVTLMNRELEVMEAANAKENIEIVNYGEDISKYELIKYKKELMEKFDKYERAIANVLKRRIENVFDETEPVGMYIIFIYDKNDESLWYDIINSDINGNGPDNYWISHSYQRIIPDVAANQRVAYWRKKYIDQELKYFNAIDGDGKDDLDIPSLPNVTFNQITSDNVDSIPSKTSYDEDSKTLTVVPRIQRPKLKKRRIIDDESSDGDSMDVEVANDHYDNELYDEELAGVLKKAREEIENENDDIEMLDFDSYESVSVKIMGSQRTFGLVNAVMYQPGDDTIVDNTFRQRQGLEDGIIRFDGSKWVVSIASERGFSFFRKFETSNDVILFIKTDVIEPYYNPKKEEKLIFWITFEDFGKFDGTRNRKILLNGSIYWKVVHEMSPTRRLYSSMDAYDDTDD